MGLGIYLTGRIRTPAERFLRQAEAWAREHLSETLVRAVPRTNSEGQEALFLRLHPAAEDVELCLPDAGRVMLSAKTSNVGPGYHIYLCDAARRLANRAGIAWVPPDEEKGTGDETGFFEGGDRGRSSGRCSRT